MADKTCPKCGKGQTVCIYLGEDKPHHHLWNHDCTNSACGLHEAFDAWDNRTPDDEYNERGPGADGGCPGHK